MSGLESWLIVSPGRTGSLTIVRAIYQLYNFDFSKINYISPNFEPKDIKPFDIIHSHNIEWLNYVADHTTVIVSTRNPIESALSYCILPEIGTYHFYPFKKEDVEKVNSFKIKKFYLDTEKFLETYKSCISFYNKIKLKKNYKVLDYSQWNENPKSIAKLLGLNLDLDLKHLTLKNPGKHKDFILNWEEIEKLCQKLSPIVPKMSTVL